MSVEASNFAADSYDWRHADWQYSPILSNEFEFAGPGLQLLERIVGGQ